MSNVVSRLATAALRTLTSTEASHRAVAELTDEELEAELLRRRRLRASSRSIGGPSLAGAERDNPAQKQLVQYYANLELPPYATADEVKRAYRDLVRRYHPDKHAGDAARHKAATELVRSLTTAYEELMRFLDPNGT